MHRLRSIVAESFSTKGIGVDFKDLTPEQQEKARACKTPEDVLALAKAEGYELSDEDLEAVSGGIEWGEFIDAIVDCTLLG